MFGSGQTVAWLQADFADALPLTPYSTLGALSSLNLVEEEGAHARSASAAAQS